VYGGTVTVTCGSPDTSCGCGCRYGGGWTCYWPILDQVPDGFNTFCESDEVEKCGLTQGKHVVEYHWLMNVGALGDVQSWSRNAFEGASSRAMYGPSGCPELQTNRVFCSDGYSDSQWANYDKVLDYYEAGTPVVLYNKTSTTYESVITDDCYCGWSSSSTVEKFSAWIKDCTTGQMKDITGEIMLRDTVKYCAIPSGQCLDGRENPLGFIFTNSKASSSPYCVTNPLP
jgi:hypothetical protein